jgi:hypothetical protein
VNLRLLPGRLAVCRLPAATALPEPVAGPLWSVTRTAEELSLVVPEGSTPEGARVEGGLRAFQVEGPLDFSLVGILAGLARSLADAGVSLFALSTFDCDYLLVHEVDLPRAIAALTSAGHRVSTGDGPEAERSAAVDSRRGGG